MNKMNKMNKMDKDGVDVYEKANIANSFQRILESREVFIKQIELFAEFRYKKFSALVKSGFTEEQALHIVERTDVFI